MFRTPFNTINRLTSSGINIIGVVTVLGTTVATTVVTLFFSFCARARVYVCVCVCVCVCMDGWMDVCLVMVVMFVCSLFCC